MTTVQQQTTVNLNTSLFNGLETILRSYGEDVARALASKYSFDADEAIASLVPTPHMSVPAPKAEKKAVAKRGRSAYAFYMKDPTVREAVKTAHPDWAFGDISKAIAENWKQMSAEGRQKYVDQSEAEKATLLVDGPIRLDEPPKKAKKAKSAATSSDEEGVEAKPKKAKKAKKALQVVQNSSDDLIASLVAKANAAPALTIQVDGMDESPTSAGSASHVAAAPAAPAPAAEQEDAAKAEKKRKANEKRKATLAAKKSKKAEDALAAQMGNMTLQSELQQEQMVVTPPAPKAASPKAASPKAASPKAASPKDESNDGSALATDFVHEGKCYYNQEGWLYDKTTRACVGFWNGSEIEPVDDESDEE
jgi:hypothetical protein